MDRILPSRTKAREEIAKKIGETRILHSLIITKFIYMNDVRKQEATDSTRRCLRWPRDECKTLGNCNEQFC
jgi:hypothetical protein